MSSEVRSEFKRWNIAAVRLLQNVVYQDDHKNWSVVLDSKARLSKYFASLGVNLVVDEENGMAYLAQPKEEDVADGFQDLPKLFGKRRLGYEATLMSVLLRSELLRFDAEEIDSTRCIISTDQLYEQWKVYFHKQQDEKRGKTHMLSSLRKLVEVGFVREIKKQDSWEIRPIIKARLSAEDLEELRIQMVEAAQQRMQGE